jgi:hypothetical protein
MSTKRASLAAIFDKLEKLLPHLGNENPAEADNARTKINRLLKSVKLDWHDLSSLLMSGKDESGNQFAELLAKLLGTDDDNLIVLARKSATFFHDRDGGTFADIVINARTLTYPVDGDEFTDWLIHLFYKEFRRAPKEGALKTARATLRAQAEFEGERLDVHFRAGKVRDVIYIDIGDADQSIAEITKDGWRITKSAPIRFRRSRGFRSLPFPKRGGSIAMLRDLVNINNEGFALYVSWTLSALCPDHPHPVLYLVGEEGSAKTTAANIARALTDPSSLPLRNLPTSKDNLFVGSDNARVLAFDNVSTIGADISDALCQIVSGSDRPRRS